MTLLSLDGASQFEVESFLLERAGDLAISWEAYGCDDVTRVGFTRRRPGGRFDRIRYLSSPNGQMASNATLGFDGNGSLFVAWASWTPGPDRAQPHLGVSDIHIQFARWPAGQAGFLPPVGLDEVIPDALYDKPWLLTTADDAILVSYSDLRRGGIWVAASADGGASFTRVLVDPTMGNLASLCADGRPGGAFVTYFANRAIVFAHTADGGATWSAPRLAALSDASGAVALHDPMCVAKGDEVWISYGRTGDPYDTPVECLQQVRLLHLTRGSSSPGSDVLALAAPADGFLLFPQLAAGPDDSLVLAIYRATGEGTGTADLVTVVSADGGLTFGPPAVIATGFSPTLRRHVPDWLGDYFGWGPMAGRMGAAYIDNASGFSHIALDEAALP